MCLIRERCYAGLKLSPYSRADIVEHECRRQSVVFGRPFPSFNYTSMYGAGVNCTPSSNIGANMASRYRRRHEPRTQRVVEPMQNCVKNVCIGAFAGQGCGGLMLVLLVSGAANSLQNRCSSCWILLGRIEFNSPGEAFDPPCCEGREKGRISQSCPQVNKGQSANKKGRFRLRLFEELPCPLFSSLFIGFAQ